MKDNQMYAGAGGKTNMSAMMQSQGSISPGTRQKLRLLNNKDVEEFAEQKRQSTFTCYKKNVESRRNIFMESVTADGDGGQEAD